jgi:hypothetical protein
MQTVPSETHDDNEAWQTRVVVPFRMSEHLMTLQLGVLLFEVDAASQKHSPYGPSAPKPFSHAA